MALIGKLGDFSNHSFGGSNGYIISASSSAKVTQVEGKILARVGDFHYCPIPGHGITQIINGSGQVQSEGKIVCCEGSFTACGAAILPSSLISNVPLISPPGAGKLNGPLVLGGPNIDVANTMIMG